LSTLDYSANAGFKTTQEIDNSLFSPCLSGNPGGGDALEHGDLMTQRDHFHEQRDQRCLLPPLSS